METRLDCAVSDQLALRVDFIKLADRYGHELSAVIREGSSENVVPLCASVEGASDDPWPPSPPLQSLSIEKLSDGRTAALLVGMAGRSHWSASIATKPDESVKGMLEFDYACRFAGEAQSASCEYRIPRSIAAALDPKTSLVLLRTLDVGTICIGLASEGKPIVLDGGAPKLRFEVPVDNKHRGATLRWRYVVWFGRIG